MTTAGRGLTHDAERTAKHAERQLGLHMGPGTLPGALARQARKDHLAVHAGNLAYHMLFALFPALISFFWLLKLFGATQAISGLIDLAVAALPGAASGTIKQQLQSVSGAPASGNLTIGTVFAALLTVWAVSQACSTAMSALNAMYGVEEGRPFLKRQLIALGLSVAVASLLIGTVVILVLGSAIATKLSEVAGTGSLLHWLWLLGSWPLVLAAVTLAFALLFYFGPDVEQEFRWIRTGTLAGVLLWLGFAALFSLYINNFASPGQTYGALAGVAVLMIYVYGSSLILLLGAEINQVVEMRQPDGKQDGEKQPEPPSGSLGPVAPQR